MPDSTASGGNKRGGYAVDFQCARAVASQVASGGWATISGGTSNTASGNYSSVGGGQSCNAGGNYSTIAGGYNHVASGTSSSVLGGSTNTVTGNNSAAIGGTQCTDRGLNNAVVHASGQFSSLGDAQSRRVELRVNTANANATTLTSDAAAAAASNIFVLPDNSAYAIEARIVSRSTPGDAAAYKMTLLVKRGSGAATVAIVGTPTITTIAADSGASAWAVSASVNTTLGGLLIQFTGAASTNIRTVAYVESTEVAM